MKLNIYLDENNYLIIKTNYQMNLLKFYNYKLDYINQIY